MIDSGLSGYEDMLDRQLEIFERIKEGSGDDTLIVTRHRPIITLGRSARIDDLLFPLDIIEEKGVSVREVGRGGGTTYHGPGQLVLYPICDLRNFDKNLRTFIRNLEKVMKETANCFDLSTKILDGYPGLWMEDNTKKLGSLGLSVKKWITYHGLAFNVDLNKEKSSLLKPCGMKNVSLVSLKDYRDVSIETVKANMLQVFCEVLNVELEE